MQKGVGQTKYSMLKEYLKDEILMGNIKPGDKIPSEKNLAEKLSLSRHTVRKAISILANEGFLYTEHGKGTFCRDISIRRKDSRNIGVITTYISEYIFPRVIQGIDKVLSETGYSIMLKNTGNSSEKEALCLEDILEKDIEGLIIEPTKSALFSNNLKYYEALDSHHIPYVFIHGWYQNLENKPHVVLDDETGVYSAVEYLIKLGHKDIVGIFKADDAQGINRHKGYARALAEYGLSYNPDRVVWFHTEDREVKPCTAVKGMIESGYGIDAVVAYNDEIALKIFELLREMKLNVPEDISIIGFDDSYLAVSGPVKLTTVAHPKEKLGEAAANLLLEILRRDNNGQNFVNKVITPELIIRDSCKDRRS